MESGEIRAEFDFDPKKYFSSLFVVAKTVLLSPGLFYEGMKREGGLKNPVIFLASCVLIHSLMVGLSLRNGAMIARNLVFGMTLPFVTAGILFVIITKLFKGSGTYEMAFRVNAYSGAVALLAWIPLVGIVLLFYQIYLIVVGLSRAFVIRASHAFLAVVLTIVTYLLAYSAIYHLTGGP